jgi:pilus assembly protein Flp/PilA
MSLTLPPVFPFDPLEECPIRSLISRVQRFVASEDGPTAVEYAVMLAHILVACITIITTLGTSISSTFGKVNSSLGGSS